MTPDASIDRPANNRLLAALGPFLQVYGVDVGHGQVMGSIAQDQRVTVMERTNLRHLRPDQLPEQVSSTASVQAAVRCVIHAHKRLGSASRTESFVKGSGPGHHVLLAASEAEAAAGLTGTSMHRPKAGWVSKSKFAPTTCTGDALAGVPSKGVHRPAGPV